VRRARPLPAKQTRPTPGASRGSWLRRCAGSEQLPSCPWSGKAADAACAEPLSAANFPPGHAVCSALKEMGAWAAFETRNARALASRTDAATALCAVGHLNVFRRASIPRTAAMPHSGGDEELKKKRNLPTMAAPFACQGPDCLLGVDPACCDGVDAIALEGARELNCPG
jgi:hypothetical protein